MSTETERSFDVGDIVKRRQDGELGYIDEVLERAEWIIAGGQRTRRWTGSGHHIGYAIHPFSGKGKRAWFDNDELELVERGPVFALRKALRSEKGEKL